MPPYLVRTAQPSDCSQVAALCIEHAVFERATPPVHVDAQALGRLLFADRPRLHALVAATDSDVVAYATFTFDVATWRLATYMHVDCLYVAARHRGNGLGRRLMKALADIARQRECDSLEWQTPAWNEAAMQFYARLGADRSAKVRFRLGTAPSRDAARFAG